MSTFDARAAKLLVPGEVLTLDDHPGLRLKASASFRTWTYRYKSPVDGQMRQIKIGRWPDVSVSAAIVAWEELRKRRDAGEDLAAEKRAARAEKAAQVREEVAVATAQAYTVRSVCNEYLAEHVHRHRAKKGADEIERMFSKMLDTVEGLPAADITRSQAFDLIQLFAGSAPVQAGKLRTELGAAWDHALDAGRLPNTTPNWWRLILRGKIRSKGKRINGKNIGTAKRVLSEVEVGELIRWLPNFTDIIADALVMYLWTGTRGAENVAVLGEEVTEEADGWWWTVPKEKTKNARHEDATDLRVPLVGRALEVIRRRMEWYGKGPLFPAKKSGPPTSIEQNTIQTRIYYHQPYCQTRPTMKRARLTVTHWTPHDLRRTTRTLLARLGCPSDTGEVIIGHMLGGSEGIYNLYAYDAERRVWLTKVSDHLECLAAQV